VDFPCDPDLLERLRAATRHHGTGAGGGFAFDLDLSAPMLVTAIHAGHTVRAELLPLLRISEKDRLLEEDAGTDHIIQGNRSVVWGLDSRAEYDLNRPPEEALPLTPERFWGVPVYGRPPAPEIIRRSLDKHEAFYRFIGTCLRILLERFGACFVYDIHSYNLARQIEHGIDPPPTFNLGTALLDRRRWATPVDGWLQRLRAIELPGLTTTVAENHIYSGRGEFCRRLTRWHPDILVLPTEIAKVYMDEREGVLFPARIDALNRGLRQAIASHAQGFLPLSPS
jgi:N-formylglutamate amidohydrolase